MLSTKRSRRLKKNRIDVAGSEFFFELGPEFIQVIPK